MINFVFLEPLLLRIVYLQLAVDFKLVMKSDDIVCLLQASDIQLSILSIDRGFLIFFYPKSFQRVFFRSLIESMTIFC